MELLCLRALVQDKNTRTGIDFTVFLARYSCHQLDSYPVVDFKLAHARAMGASVRFFTGVARTSALVPSRLPPILRGLRMCPGRFKVTLHPQNTVYGIISQ